MLHRIRIGLLLLFPFAILLSINPSGISAQTVQKKNSSPMKEHRAVIHKYSSKRKHHKHHKDSVAVLSPQFRKNYPPPGSGGEDRNFDWLFKRSFPNGYIDPEYYPHALAEARKLPVWQGNSHNGIQSAMPWQQIGPFNIGGRVTAIATHPTDSNTFYVGAASGGLWKTSDHGNSWMPLTDTFAMLPIGCVTLDPHDPATIYIGMGECNGSGDSYAGNGVWRSTDDGISWTSLGLSKTQYIAKIIVDPTDKNIIYVCAPGTQALSGTAADSNRGVYKSTDFGATWTQSLLIRIGKSKTSTPVPVIDLVMNPSDHTDLVASSWQQFTFSVIASPFTGLWRSRDAGLSWYRIDTLPGSGHPNGNSIKRLSRISLLWVTSSKGVPTLYSSICKFDKNPLTGDVIDAENFYGIYRTADPESGWQKVLDSNFRI
ncbi:MAG: WD40/YVTN/BNR-like repeat-containing protein, partial [Candidatus Kapaibacterium sp.]